MTSPRTILVRVAKLERAKLSVALRLIGSLEQFEADALAGIADGTLGSRDMHRGAGIRAALDSRGTLAFEFLPREIKKLS